MKIRNKLIVSYMAIILVIIGLSLIILMLHDSLINQQNKISNAFSELSTVIERYIDIHQGIKNLDKAILEKGWKAEKIKTIKENILNKTNELYVAIKKSTNNETLAEFKRTRDKFDEDFARIFALFAEGKYVDAVDIYRNTIRDKHIKELEDILQKVNDEKEAQVVAAIKEGERLNSYFRRVLFVLISVSVLLVLIISILVARSIIRPINRLINATTKIEKGELDTDIPVNTHDEVGLLAGSFKQMIDNLKRVMIHRNYFENIINSMAEALLLISLDGKIITVNRSASTLLLYKKEELIGKQLHEVFYAEQGKSISIDELKQFKTIRVLERKVRSKDGKIIPIHFSSSIMYDTAGKEQGIVCLIEDISRIKEIENEKEILRKQLLHAQKMEAIGTFVGGIAHDFNNMLTPIMGYTEMMMMKFSKDDRYYNLLEEMRIAAKRAADLTHKLLTFSRKEITEVKVININQRIEDISKTIQRIIGENIAVNIDLEPNLWMTLADSTNLDQIIMNLVVNAKDAMPDGGKITIRTKNMNIDSNYCRLHADARPGKYILLAVSDTGSGMDKETIQHIFEPFFTTKEAGKGTGLGLSVVYGIIKELNGWIDVKSEIGKGTTFEIYLPATSKEAKDETEVEFSLQQYQGNGEHVLIVEDDESIRRYVTRVLHDNGYSVLEAGSAKEALELFEINKDNIDLVFSDVILPDMTGLELIEKLLSFNPELKVLLTSGYAGSKQVPKIKEKGYVFLPKPYFLMDFLKAVKHALSRSTMQKK